jgi:hypothetical protein
MHYPGDRTSAVQRDKLPVMGSGPEVIERVELFKK